MCAHFRHTNCAVFLLGALLFILLPTAIASLEAPGEDMMATSSLHKVEATEETSGQPAEVTANRKLVGKTLARFNQIAPGLWIAGSVATASGRVLGVRVLHELSSTADSLGCWHFHALCHMSKSVPN